MADSFVSMIEENKKSIDKMMAVVRLTGVAFTNFGKALVGMFTNMSDGQKHLLALIAGVYGLNKALKMSPMGKLMLLITGLILVLMGIESYFIKSCIAFFTFSISPSNNACSI